MSEVSQFLTMTSELLKATTVCALIFTTPQSHPLPDEILIEKQILMITPLI